MAKQERVMKPRPVRRWKIAFGRFLADCDEGGSIPLNARFYAEFKHDPAPAVVALINAAPDLLAELQALQEAASTLFADCDERGETRDKGGPLYPEWEALRVSLARAREILARATGDA